MGICARMVSKLTAVLFKCLIIYYLLPSVLCQSDYMYRARHENLPEVGLVGLPAWKQDNSLPGYQDKVPEVGNKDLGQVWPGGTVPDGWQEVPFEQRKNSWQEPPVLSGVPQSWQEPLFEVGPAQPWGEAQL